MLRRLVRRRHRFEPVLPPARGRPERRTYMLAAIALTTTLAVIGGELARVWRRGSAPVPSETDDVLEAGVEAALESVEVAVSGYRETSRREAALFNLLVSFVLTFGFTRLTAHTIRSRGAFGPLRDVVVGDRHVHHFIPGITLAFLAGGASIAIRDEQVDPWLAIPFGAGVAMTLDESALLLHLEDVYWTEEGVVSVQVTLAATALLGATVLALRLLRRGEQVVLEATSPRSAT
jgi:hypothetical protein